MRNDNHSLYIFAPISYIYAKMKKKKKFNSFNRDLHTDILLRVVP